MNKLILLVFYLKLVALFFITTRCGTSIPTIPLNKEYSIEKKESITIYVIPSANESLDETYIRVLHLDLQSRGYKVTDANTFLEKNSDNIQQVGHRKTVDSLLMRNYLPSSDIYVIVKPEWDSVYFAVDYFQKRYQDHMLYGYLGMNVSRLSSEIAFYDPRANIPIKSITGIDTTRLFAEKEGDKFFIPERPWMTIARQLTKCLSDVPLCTITDNSPAPNEFDVIFWVDQTYRDAFPNEWKERLQLRFLYANDILKSQLGINLNIAGFKEWDSRFGSQLNQTQKKLNNEKRQDQNKFQIGITLDKSLKTDWTDRSTLGLAWLTGDCAVISAQPSYPEVADYWNPIEEAITIVHELAHLFGAIHVNDYKSIMYPSSGYLSYEFDDINRSIIESTKNNFFNITKKQRAQNYAQQLVSFNRGSNKNKVPVLASISAAINLSESLTNSFITDSLNMIKSIYEFTSDSAHTYAILGFMAMQVNLNREAESFLQQAINIEPDFAEAHYYLSKAQKNIRKAEESEHHRLIAKPYKKYWVIEDTF